MMWRPECWSNPYRPADESEPHPMWAREAKAFEAGADALLEALREYRDGSWKTNMDGRWVLIPHD